MLIITIWNLLKFLTVPKDVISQMPRTCRFIIFLLGTSMKMSWQYKHNMIRVFQDKKSQYLPKAINNLFDVQCLPREIHHATCTPLQPVWQSEMILEDLKWGRIWERIWNEGGFIIRGAHFLRRVDL